MEQGGNVSACGNPVSVDGVVIYHSIYCDKDCEVIA